MGKASEKEMADLHGTLAKELAKLVKKDPSASILNVARQFLKDNGIEASEGNEDVDEISRNLQDLDQDVLESITQH